MNVSIDQLDLEQVMRHTMNFLTQEVDEMSIPGFSGEASIYPMSDHQGRAMRAGQRNQIVPALKSTTDCSWPDGATVCCVTHNRYGVGTCCCNAGVGCGCGYKSKFNGDFEP
jgi:hypothetical protein